MSSVLQRLLHNLNLHSLLPSHWDSMAVVVGLGWCMTVLSPDVTFHIQQRMGYQKSEIRNHLFNMYTYKKKKKSTHGKQTDGKAIGQYS